MPNADANSPCSLPQERQLLPAGRTPSSVVNSLICMASWSIGRAIFCVVLSFLPALRERRGLAIEAQWSPNSEGFPTRDSTRGFFLLSSAITAGPRQQIGARADVEGGQ